MDLTFPPGSTGCSVNDGIPQDTYLGEYYKLRLLGIDRLVEFILEKGRHRLVLKKDLLRAYRQYPIDPKDYHLLGFRYQGKFYFATRCPFGLRSSAMLSISSTSRSSQRMFIFMTFTVPNIRPLPLRHFLNSACYFINLVWILLLTRIHRLRPL